MNQKRKSKETIRTTLKSGGANVKKEKIGMKKAKLRKETRD